MMAQINASNHRPTNAQLARIWPPWNALPAELSPEDKCKILIYKGEREAYPDPRRVAQIKDLQRTFPFLPFGPEYTQALRMAVLWQARTAFAHRTLKHSETTAREHGAFAHADFHASEDVAIFRAAKEIEMTESDGFLDDHSPSLEKIELIEKRYQAYLQSHKRAFDELTKRIYGPIYKFPGVVRYEWLPVDKVALGWPNSPDVVPRHLFIARLDALYICGPERFANFIRADFPRLTRHERQEFYKMSLTARVGKDANAALAVWLLDNRPIFENQTYRWQWGEIRDAALALQIPCPENIKQFNYDQKLGIKIARGTGSILNLELFEMSKKLLSPKPVFADRLQAA
jgi:hypothetical protein